MRKEKNKYIENISKEEQSTFEFEEYPQLHEYYCKRMKSHKKPTKIILTEIYSPSQTQNANIKSYNNINQNRDEFYSSYKKNIYFDDSAFNPYYEMNNSQTENFSENFKYYERKNIRDNSNQKYESITRIIGHSNIIPLKNQEISKNYTTINFNKNEVGQKLQNFQNYQKNVKKEEYNKYIAKNNNNKIKQQKDYRIKKEKTVIEKNIKKEFKKPINIEKSKRTEIIKKYEIVNNKKPEIKKKVENDYKKYERKKKDETKQEIKIKTQSTQSKNKTQVQKKTEIKKAKEPIKEPKIINSRELIKKEFSVHSGRYSYKENISNDITNSRKNYNANSQDKNLKRITVVQNSNKSNKSQNKNTQIKKEEKTKKLNTSITKKVNTSQNMSINNKRKNNNEIKRTQNNANKNKNINIKTEAYGKIDMSKYKRKNPDTNNNNKTNKITNMKEVKEVKEIYHTKINNINTNKYNTINNNKYNSINNNRSNTPKIEKVNFGENYRFYERKYLQSPDESCFTIHHKRSHKIIFDGQEDDELINSYAYKSKPCIREERYNNKIISNIDEPFDEDEDYYYRREGTYYY